jgi:2-keto-4-pentenoate hydratase/2-oxohepta-3-ene-1,7-dioic acid hydratase in catechol pathway
MRLVTFSDARPARVGAVVDDEVVDLSDVVARTMLELLTAGAGALDAARRALGSAPRVPLATVRLHAPVPRPPKFLAIFLNYPTHAAEVGQGAPDFPVFFNKQSTCVVGPGDAIHVPPESMLVDYEGELAVVIGRRCRRVPAARAAEVIAGYTITNDVTVRDWQVRAPTVTLGKSWDTHGPLGPWLVTGDEVGDPHALRLRTLVNGERRQDAVTGDMLVDCFRQVEFLSTAFTLEPGDVIATGTPAGIGAMQNPPRFLRAGDLVRVEIDALGALENPVVDEPPPEVA